MTDLGLSATDVLAVGTEGSDKVGGGEETVLVRVHDAEGLLLHHNRDNILSLKVLCSYFQDEHLSV